MISWLFDEQPWGISLSGTSLAELMKWPRVTVSGNDSAGSGIRHDDPVTTATTSEDTRWRIVPSPYGTVVCDRQPDQGQIRLAVGQHHEPRSNLHGGKTLVGTASVESPCLGQTTGVNRSGTFL